MTPSVAARGGARGGAKMNFPILTFTRVWVIKSRLINSVDSESGRIFMIGPTQERLGAGQGAGQKLTSLF